MTMSVDYQDINGLALIDVTGAQTPVTFPTDHLWGDSAWQRVALP